MYVAAGMHVYIFIIYIFKSAYHQKVKVPKVLK